LKPALIHNGRIITLDSDYPEADWLLIENGSISLIGFGEPDFEFAQNIDLGGRLVLPAFRDVHVHFFQTGIRMLEFDGWNCKSEENLLGALDQWIANKGEVNGFGYSPVGDGDLPKRTQLDAISRDVPIFLRRVDGHSSCLNTVAMRLIEDRIDKLSAVDLDNGWLFGGAHMAVDRFFLDRISHQRLATAAGKVADYALSKGCSCVAAMVPRYDWMRIFLELDLPIKTTPWLETMEPRDARELGLTKVGGCLPMADGSFGSHTALLIEDYSDKPGCHGEEQIEQEILDIWVKKAVENGLQTAVHAIGDGGVEMVLHALEGREEKYTNMPARIEHAELLSDNQIGRISSMGISLAVQPVFEELWGGANKLYGSRLGKRWEKTNRFRDLLDSGVNLAGSSDSYITPIDPLRGIRAAINHPNSNQSVTPIEAISMFTIGGAIAERKERSEGSISIGKSADLVVLSGDIDDITRGESSVHMVIIDGEIRYKLDIS